MTPSTIATSAIANNGCISPLLTDSNVRLSAPGRPATMPERMIIEMPLPTPRSVICSPSHIRNIVPVVIVVVAISSHCGPPLSTYCPFCNATAAPNDWNTARPTVA